ncbi:hypothetical protein KUCAC02_014118, partial [Chaenocephalus aceratus]
SAVPQPTFSMPVTVPVSNQNAALQFSNNPGGALVTTTSFLTSALTDPRLLSPQQPTLHRTLCRLGYRSDQPAQVPCWEIWGIQMERARVLSLRVSPEKQRHVGEGNQEEVETRSEAPQRLPGRFQAQKPREENLKERDNIRARGVSASWSRRQHSPPLNEAPVVVFLLRRLHVHILL